MEEYILYISSLISNLRGPVRPCLIDVSKSSNLAIKYRLSSIIVVLEVCNDLYGYTELLLNNPRVVHVIVNGIWVVSGLNKLSPMLSLYRNKYLVSQIFTKWDAMLLEREELMSPQESDRMKRKENRTIKSILGFYIYYMIISGFGVANHFYGKTKTAIYLYNRFNFDPTNKTLKIIFAFHELLWLFLGIFIQSAPEIFLQLFALRLQSLLEALKKCDVGDGVRRYKSLVMHCALVNGVFQWWIQRVEIVLVTYVSLILYTAIRQFGLIPFLEWAMFTSNGVLGIIRNTVMLTRLGQANSKSIDLIQVFQKKPASLLLRKQLKTLEF